VNATIPKAEELMKAAVQEYEPVIYKGAWSRVGFMRKANAKCNEANKKARDDSWAALENPAHSSDIGRTARCAVPYIISSVSIHQIVAFFFRNSATATVSK